MKTGIFQIKDTICPLFSEPNKKSAIYTELLFGEKVKISSLKKNWAFCVSKVDGYKGWLQFKNLTKARNSTHIICSRDAIVYYKPDEKSSSLFNLSLGSQIVCYRSEGDWFEINFDYNTKKRFGYVHFSNLRKINETTENWVDIAENFISTPYKWGGRSFIGIDCSGLLQICIAQKGIKVPRDTVDQVNCNFLEISHNSELKRGDIVFWKGHVGIMQNKIFMLHANAKNMKVSSEKLSLVIKRHNKTVGTITSILRLPI